VPTAGPTATPPPPRVVNPPAPPAPPAPLGDQPGALNTGVPQGVSLTDARGMTVTQDNTVLDGLSVNGAVTIAANNVVIKNSRIVGDGGGNGVYVRSGSLTITDSEISNFENGIAGDSWTAERVEISGVTGDGAKIGSDVTLRDSWIHALAPSAGAHADGLQVQSGISGTLIEHNTISAYDPSTRVNGNSAMFIAPDVGPSSPGPLVIRNNWLDGGNFTVQILDGNYGQYFITSISFTGNRFGRNSAYGPLRVNVPVTLSGNVWADNGQSID
jgi:hypothetical protein